MIQLCEAAAGPWGPAAAWPTVGAGPANRACLSYSERYQSSMFHMSEAVEPFLA